MNYGPLIHERWTTAAENYRLRSSVEYTVPNYLETLYGVCVNKMDKYERHC